MSAPSQSSTPRPSRRRWIVLSCVLFGAVAGFVVSLRRSVFYATLEHEGPLLAVDREGREVVIPPRDPNGYLKVGLFGNQIHQESGPYEDVSPRWRWWEWSIAGVFVLAGANVGLIVGYIMRGLTWLVV